MPFRRLATASLAALALTFPAHAGDKPLGPRVSIELNTVASVEQGCTLTFLVQNGHETDIAKAVYETVLFDTSGEVDRLTLFDFGALPAGRPRVRQFVVPGIACAGLGQILFNGVQACEAPDAGACETGLELNSRVGSIGVIG